MEAKYSLGNSKIRAHEDTVVSGEYVLHTLIAEFTIQVERKFDALLVADLSGLNSDSATKDRFTKSLQRGEDPQFDQLLSSLGCVAEHCLPSLLETLFKWYEHQLPNSKRILQKESTLPDSKQHKSSTKSKSDSSQLHEDYRAKCREMAVEFVFCLVLIEVLRQLPVHPLPDRQIRSILMYAFDSFYRSAEQKGTVPINPRIVADLYAEAIGVLAQTKFQAVRNKFMYELLKEREKEPPTSTIVSLIMGMKFFRVKMYPIEDFEASFRFLQELANYSLDVKNREIKHALAGLFVEILVPVAAAVKTEVNVPVLRDFVDSLYPTCLELSKRQKNKLAMYPLVTCLLCVSQKQFFLNNWHIFLDNCLSTLKKNDQKLSRVALESLYRLLWVYMVRIKCESNTATQSRLQSIIKSLFPVGSRSVVPKDTPLNIFVKIIQFIAQERLDFAMKEIILDLLSISLSGSRSTKPMNIHPERMNIGLRAFLVITDSLQQKDGAPPMPSTVGVMPSGSTLRVKKTFLNKTLTEDEARTIGVSHYHKHVQKALDGILLSLDNQVGQRMMLTNSQLSNKDPQDLLTGELKPKVELFRTCVAAIPRLMPTGMSQSDLLEMLSRLTVHVDEELRGRAFSALQSFAIDFPTLREEVVATFLSFVLKQVSDVHQVMLDGSLKMLVSLITAWKNNAANSGSNNTPSSRFRNKGAAHSSFPDNSNSSFHLSNGKCIYAPIINRVEGFALVLLCSSRSMTRKLACHILKEIRALAHSLDYGKHDDSLCLDVLDSLCPEVAHDVIVQKKALQELEQADRDGVISVASRRDVSALVECSSNWHEHNALHPWVLFMSSFIETFRLPKLCPTAISYSWPDVYIRLSQIQQHIDPTTTSGSKKVAPTPINNDQSLMLWTNYLVFACKCAPSSVSIKQKQSKESAIAAGTPDWQVALTRDSERITAIPSSLFQRLITQLRAEGSLAHREAAVIGLGSTSVIAFSDLMTELLTVIHEASETKKQENVRRKRKRDNVRVVLAKVLARLASHKVLSEGILNELAKSQTPGGNPKKWKSVIVDYIDEMRALLESAENLNTNFTHQHSSQLSSSFPGSHTPMSPNLSVMGLGLNSTTDELRLNFGEMIIQLIRHMPLDRRSQLMTPETKKLLFSLFEKWCKKFATVDQKNYHEKSAKSPSQLYTALRAECAVLCCGPVFDQRKGLGKNGYLYDWLVTLLDCPNPNVHNIGREAVVLMLHYNSNIPLLLSWIVDKCYTGSTLVSTGCFLGIATQFANSEYSCSCVTMLCLALYKIADHDPNVSQTAEHLLIILLSRYFPPVTDKSQHDTSKRNSSVFCNLYKGIFSKFGVHPERLHSLSQVKLSEELARSHPEITLSILSEIFLRFPAASQIGQRQMLELMQPWLQNIELSYLASPPFNSNLDSSFHHTLGISNTMKGNGSQNHSWMPMEGWGSDDATLLVLNNLTYITACYHATLGSELEKCWVTMCDTWPRNLSVCLEFLLAFQSIQIREELTRAARLVISYLARSKSSRVIRFLIKDCQIAEPVTTVVASCDEAPYYKIMSLTPEFHVNNNGAPEKKTSPRNGHRTCSAHNIGALSAKEEEMTTHLTPGTQADRYPQNQTQVHANSASVAIADTSSVVLPSSYVLKNHNAHSPTSTTTQVKSNQGPPSSFTSSMKPTPSTVSPKWRRATLTPPGYLSSSNTRHEPHHLSLQQLHAPVADDKNSDKFSVPATSSPTSSALRLLKGKNNSRKLRNANMSSMPTVLSSSMFALNTNVEAEAESSSLSNCYSSPPARLNKFRYSHHEQSLSNSKLHPKFASTRELSTNSSTSERADLGRGNILSKKQMQKDKRSSMAEPATADTTEQSVTQVKEDELKEFLKWRAVVGDTMCPQPLPMPNREVLLPLLDYILCFNKIDGQLRSNIACILLSEMMLQHGIYIDWQTHLPVILLSVILNMDQFQIPEVPFHCQRLLAHIIIKLCPHSVPSQVACSVISCKLDSEFHMLVSRPISSLIRSGAGEKTDAVTPMSIGGMSFPGDSGISSPSSAASSTRGSLLQTTENIDPVSLSSGLSSPIVEMNESRQSGDYGPGVKQTQINPLLQQLISSSVQQWGYEDVTPKNLMLKSVEYLTSFVQQTVSVFDKELPNFNIKERLGTEALKFVLRASSKHHANRALQVFRALKLSLPPTLLSDLVQCLLYCIAEGSDPESQGHFIEILSTLLHACDTPPPPERDKEDTRQQRSRSFTPDHSWRLSMGAPNSTHITSSTAPSTPTVSTSHPKPPGKFSSAQVSGLSLLPNKLSLSLTSPAMSPESPSASPSSTSSNGTLQGSTTPTTRSKKGHAHRRSGSVTLSKKMVEEVTQSAFPRILQDSVISPPPLPQSPPAGSTSYPPSLSVNVEKKCHISVPSRSVSAFAKDVSEMRCQPSQALPTTIHKTQSADTICLTQKSSHSAESNSFSSQYSSIPPVNSTEEWKNMLAQMFWIGVALLESDYEHEFLLAVQLIEKVLVHLPMQYKEGRFHIERYLCQIKWSSFPGIQNLLLKGLTSAATADSTFRLLSSLTTVSNLSLVSGDNVEGNGFAMNVIGLLPHLVDHFGDPDLLCCESAQNIAQVCVDDYKDRKKLQSLAHVMSLYSNRTYGKPCLTWVSVVCKYVHETFPHTIQQHLSHLVDMLEKGPASSHQSCLQIIYSLLSLSDILSSTPGAIDIKFNHDVLRTVSKFINNTKHWKEALNILKLAVSRCSAITQPSSGLIRSDLSDLDRIELPGRTLTFEFDVKRTPIVGEKKSDGVPGKRGLSHHTSTTSPPLSGWKRPHLSQRRTHDKILFILPICGQHLPTQGEVITSPVHSSHVPEPSLAGTKSGDEILNEENVFEADNEDQSEKSEQEGESGVDDIYVLKNFDFLDEELELNEDGFAMIQNQNSTLAILDTEGGATEDEPDTYDITPHREANQDLTLKEEDEEEESGQESKISLPAPESDASSLSPTSSTHSIPDITNVITSDIEEEQSMKMNKRTSCSSIKKSQGRKKGKRKYMISKSVSKKYLENTHIATGSSTESVGSNSLSQMIQHAQSHNTVAGSNLYQRTISPLEIIRPPESIGNNDADSYQGNSSDSAESEDENSSCPTKSSNEDLSDENEITQPKIDSIPNDKHLPLQHMYPDIPHTPPPPPPPSNINSEPVDIPVAPPPPVDDLISNSSSTHSESATFGGAGPGSPFRHVFSESSFSKTSSPSREPSVPSTILHHGSPSVQSLSLPRYLSKSSRTNPKLPATIASFSASYFLSNPPPWNAPSPLPPTMESHWQLHIQSVSTDVDGFSVSRTFDLFPMLFRVLCIDFSSLSKEGCKHLGSQLSKIAEHFSSMVEQLPSQIQCPSCLTTKGTVDPVVEQLKFGVLELQEHFETYNTKKKNALQCLELVKEMKLQQNFPSSFDRNSSTSPDDLESLGQKMSDSADSIELSSSNSSSHSLLTPSPPPQPACTNPATLKCQLELCRLLYKLHFQLLLLLKSFNKLIHLVTNSTPDNKNITEQMNLLRKKLFAVENSMPENDRHDDNSEILAEMKSMTREEAEQALATNVAAENVNLAISQLSVLRDVWPPEVFGTHDDTAADCLTKVYFKHMEEKSGGKFYAVLGSDDITHGVCEKLMEVNSQIQQSLRSLAMIPPTSSGTSRTSLALNAAKKTLL